MSNETPLACDLTAIKKDELELHKENGESVFRSVLEVRELSVGYAFRIPAETAIVERAGGFIARERLCCPFFSFTLEVTPERGPVWLKITGNERVKKYMKETILSQLDAETDEWGIPDD